jgi:type I restriction enzyme S subunit
MKHKWPITKLGEVLTERRETPTDDDLASGRVRIVAKISFDSGRIQLRVGGSTKTGMILVRPGDLVVSGINAAKGAIAIYEANETSPVAATIHYGAYETNRQRADVRFLWWMLRSHFFQELLLEEVPGGIKTELKAKRLLPIPVPLPPLAEQRRVVARIEALAAQIHEARTLRHQAAEEAEALTASAQSALSHPEVANDISVEELVGENGLRNGKSVKSTGIESSVRCLTLSAMRNGRIDVLGSKPVPMSDAEAALFQIRRGDVYVIRGNGSKHLCGRAGLITEEMPGVVFPDLFIQVALPKDRVLPEFFVAAWNSSATRSVIEEKAKTTSGIWKINQGHIFSTRIPVPPLPEQRRIVAELDAMQAEVDALKRLQAETAAELAALLPALLDRAFKGEL